jgi:uncharacterized delta-60 repeat protein
MLPIALRIVPLGLAVAFALAPAARADDGAVDHSFGSGGVVAQSLNTTVGHPDDAGFRRLIRQADGKLVAVGFARFGQDTRVLLARYTADGALDRSFSGGLVLTDVPGANRDIARDVLQLPDGRLIVVGTAFGPARSDVFLARYLSNGALDPAMGTGGIAIDRALQDNTNSFTDARANAAALLPGNRIAVAGSVKASALVSSFLLAIYDLDGHPLSRQSFSPRLPAEANDVIADPDGKIVVAGYAADGFEIARFFPNGDLDHPQFTSDTFGRGTFPDSQARVPGATISRAEALARQPDGRYVAVGYATINGAARPALARFNRTGGLDGGFGTGGMVTTLLPGTGAYSDVAVQPDGKILTAGSSTVVGDSALALARYLPDGRLDPTFGGDGLVLTRLNGSFDDAAASVLRLADGRLVAAGSDTAFSFEHRYLLIRYGQAPSACPPLVGCAVVTLLNPTTALVVPDLTQPMKIGALVRRVAGHRLIAVGRVPLGKRGAGARIRWNLRVNGHRLPHGTYVVNVRALRGSKVVEVGPPNRIVVP